MVDDRTGKYYKFANDNDTASLDIMLSPDAKGTATVPVTPIENGKVLAVWSSCQLVLLDHGNGLWAVYLHLIEIKVKSGQSVNRDDELGYPTTDPTIRDCGVHSKAIHVHLALLRGSGNAGSYISMLDRSFCGHRVTNTGQSVTLKGLTEKETNALLCLIVKRGESSLPTLLR
jgi:murein DD-endopeptidase MepM/ murein hydrolase activator NlpD